MNHDHLTDITRDLMAYGRTLGFDRLDVSAISHTLFGVRIANNSVCRENVLRRSQEISLTGYLGLRSGNTLLSVQGLDDAKQALAKFRAELAAQPENQEFTMPAPPAGEHEHRLNTQGMLSAYGPDTLYPALADEITKIRGQGLRLTGYVEALATRTTVLSTAAFRVDIDDHAITVGMTVDRPSTGAIGSAQESASGIDADGTRNLVTRVCTQATQIALINHQPTAFDPQDIRVVLSPRAVADIAGTALMYKFFDRRKVDEGRTYLSKHREMTFPAGLRFGHQQELNTPTGVYRDPNLNHRYVACKDVQLIHQGGLQDLHTDGFWAKQSGHAETYDPFFATPTHITIDPDQWTGTLASTTNDLIAATERGIYIHNTWYLRLVAEMDGTITGMTRDGVFLIEDGKLSRPLFNFRWHENPLRILAEADGATEDTLLTGLSRWSGRSRRGFFATPALSVPDFHFSSATDF